MMALLQTILINFQIVFELSEKQIFNITPTMMLERDSNLPMVITKLILMFGKMYY